MLTTDLLEDRVAVVIGAGSCGPGWGNGKASAVSFARAGATVVAVDANQAAASETASLIASEGGTAEAFEADVTSSEALRRMTAWTMEKHGRIDILHYNVGIVVQGGCVELEEEKWTRAFHVNVTGFFLACKHILPIMEKQRRGVIITTGSFAAIRCVHRSMTDAIPA